MTLLSKTSPNSRAFKLIPPDKSETSSNASVNKSHQFKCMTWNCEGFKRVSSDLLVMCRKEDPSFIFISKPWLFQSNLPLATRLFLPDYKCSLSSEDLFDPELSLTSRKAHGGVLVFWKSHLDPYITMMNIQSSSFAIFMFKHPNMPF